MNEDIQKKYEKWLTDPDRLRDGLECLFRKVYLTDSNGVEWDSVEDLELYGDVFSPLQVKWMEEKEKGIDDERRDSCG